MFTAEKIRAYVDSHRDEALHCLVEALQSPSPTGSELPMAKTMLRWLEKTGLAADVYEYQKDRPNIIAEWKGTQAGKTFLFNGHMDVFPPSETDDPTYDPWSGEVKDGRIYGRGSCDMKGGDCAALMAVKFLREMGFDPKGSVMLSFVSDEERGGEYGTLALLKDGLLKGDFGINMESTDLGVLVGHGGTYPCRIVVHGDGGHAAKPINPDDKDNRYGGEDAITKGMKAVAALNRLKEEVIEKKPETAFGRSRLTVTMFHAGVAVGNYARRAEIMIDRRYLPGETPESVDAEIIGALESVKETDSTFSYEFHPRYEPDTPVLQIPEDCGMVKTLDGICEEMFGETPVHITKVAGSDAAYIRRSIGTDMPWFGPGSPRFACADENLILENYFKCIAVYMLAMVRMLS